MTTLYDFGAKCDGVGDDSIAVNAALSWYAAHGRGVMTTPPNVDILITSQITVPTGVTLKMADGAAFKYRGSGVAVRLQPGAADDISEQYASTQFIRGHVVRVEKETVEWHDSAGKLDTTSVGIEAVNCRYGRHTFHAAGFHTNINLRGVDIDPRTGEIYAAGGVFVGNQIDIYSRNAKTHVLETRQGATGYVNQNTAYGIMRNDGGFTTAGTRGFDGTAGANGWSFINVNVEGNTIETPFIFGGPHNVIIGSRFENVPARSVRVLNGGGVVIVVGYIGSVGRDLIDAEPGAVWSMITGNGSWFSNNTASNACVTSQLTAATGFFHQNRSCDGKVLSESTHDASWKFYTMSGKYHVDTNPAGLQNPTLDLRPDTRAAYFRSASDSGAANGACAAWSWASPNSFSIFRQTWHWEDNSHQRPLRLGPILRLWSDATGSLRAKKGAPTSDTDGAVIF